MIHLRLLMVLLVLAIVPSARASDTLCIKGITKVNLLDHARVLATDRELPSEVWPAILTEGKRVNSSSQGFTQKVFWIAFTIQNCHDQLYDLILELDNPQIDVFGIYEITHDQHIQFVFETGDRFPFSKRLINNRNFLVPVRLPPGEFKTFLLKVDKRQSSVSIPLYLWERFAHREKDYEQNLGFGLYLGFMALCLVYSILTFIFLKAEIYWWYTWWIVFSALFGFTALGFSHQYLYPNLMDFNGKFRVYIEMMSLISILKFLSLFLKIENYFPRLSRYLNGVIYTLLGIMFVTPFFQQNDKFVIVALPMINLIMILGICLIVYAALKSYRLQKYTVLFFFAAFSMVILATAVIVLTEFGYFTLEQLRFNPYLLGSGMEVFIFSIGLTFQIKKVYEERNELSSRIARHQKEMMQAYIEGVEKERSRIAGELHDDIGSRLGNLRRVVGGMTLDQKEYLEQQVEKLSTDVRSLSHQLAPTISRKGLTYAAEELIFHATQGSPVQFSLQSFDVPEHLPEAIHQGCYRMLQEIINNIIKHSQATIADLQFFVHDGELVMTIEDDGVGFDVNAVKKNLGLRQLQARTEALQGTLEISSSPGQGTQIMIRIPLITVS